MWRRRCGRWAAGERRERTKKIEAGRERKERETCQRTVQKKKKEMRSKSWAGEEKGSNYKIKKTF